MTRRDTGSKPATDQPERRKEAEREQQDWADEAAQARTGDDPRAVAPHDRAGKPSTGERF